jgi:hypothetical protein
MQDTHCIPEAHLRSDSSFSLAPVILTSFMTTGEAAPA